MSVITQVYIPQFQDIDAFIGRKGHVKVYPLPLQYMYLNDSLINISPLISLKFDNYYQISSTVTTLGERLTLLLSDPGFI